MRTSTGLTEKISVRTLNGRVASAMQDQAVIRAQQAGGISPQGQIFTPLAGVLGYEPGGVLVTPTVFHDSA